MTIVEIISIAASVSLLAGWRLYLCVFAVGLAMRTGWLDAPEHLAALDALANPWVIGIAGAGAVAEFFADKIAWVDSAWDAVHTVVRPLGGALLALALFDAGDPAWQAAVLLLGGGATLLSHGAKAGTRALVNTSPEPVSNIAVSTGEDVVTGTALLAALASPVAAAIVAVVLLAAVLATLLLLRRLLRTGWKSTSPPVDGKR
jgi:hypothetical protein